MTVLRALPTRGNGDATRILTSWAPEHCFRCKERRTSTHRAPPFARFTSPDATQRSTPRYKVALSGKPLAFHSLINSSLFPFACSRQRTPGPPPSLRFSFQLFSVCVESDALGRWRCLLWIRQWGSIGTYCRRVVVVGFPVNLGCWPQDLGVWALVVVLLAFVVYFVVGSWLGRVEFKSANQ